VGYKYGGDKDDGRLWASSASLQRMGGKVRSFLTRGLYHDYDIRNCHPTIFCWMCEEEGLSTTHQRNYLRNRNTLLEDAGVDKEHLIIKFNSDEARFPSTKSKELKLLVDEWNTCKRAIYEKHQDRFEVSEKNPISSTIKQLCDIKENEILQSALPKGDNNLVLIFDGFMSVRSLDLTKFPNEVVQWEEKEIKSDVTIPDEFQYQDVKLIADDKDAVETVLQLYPHIKCCEGILYVFSEETGMWNVDEKNIYFKKILMKFKDKLEADNSHMKTPPTTDSYGGSSRRMNAVCSLIKSSSSDDNWLKKNEGSGLGKLLFADGIYDFNTKEFTKGFDPNVVFFAQIPFNFPTRDDKLVEQLKNEFFIKPFTTQQNEEGVGEYFRKRLALGIAGKHVKDFHFGLGESNAGKSKLVEMFQNAFGEYVGNFNLEQLGSKSQGDEAKEYRWALLQRHVRLLFSNECKMSVVLNGNVIKKMTGGDGVTGRGHGGNETSFIPHFAMFCLANDMMKIDPIDDGMRNRGKTISYEKKFVDKAEKDLVADKEEKMDKAFDEKLKSSEWKSAFVHLIIEAYPAAALSVPASVSASFCDWTKGMSLEDKFEEFFEFTQDMEHTVSNSELDNWRKTNKIEASGKRMANFLKKNGCEKGKSGVRFWRGLRKREESDENIEFYKAPQAPQVPQVIALGDEGEVGEIEIKGKMYFTNDTSNGQIYAMEMEGDVGDIVGRFVAGIAMFH
jgi:hypothetical protein